MDDIVKRIIEENTGRLRDIIQMFANDAPDEHMNEAHRKECQDFMLSPGEDAVVFMYNLLDTLSHDETGSDFIRKAIQASLQFFPEDLEEQSLRRADLANKLGINSLRNPAGEAQQMPPEVQEQLKRVQAAMDAQDPKLIKAENEKLEKLLKAQ